MNGDGRWLRVLPDGERVDEAMAAHAEATGGFVDGRAWMSFRQLMERLEGARALGRRRCEPLVSRMILWDAETRMGPGPFGRFAEEPAFARAVLDLILDAKAGGADAQAFAGAVSAVAPDRRERAARLAQLFGAYESRLAELGLCDREDELRGACQVLQAGLPSFLRAFQGIELSGIHDFSPLRRRWVVALSRACAAAGVAFRVEVPASGEPAVDAVVDTVFAEHERKQEAPDLELWKQDLVGEGRPLAPLGKWLFQATAEPGVARELGSALELATVSSTRDEARYLARRAAALVELGAAPERIAIVYRDLGEEAEWLIEELEALGLPARARLGVPLGATAAGRLALGLVHCVEEGFPAAEVARLLTSRYLPRLGGRVPDAPARWLALAGIRDHRLGAEGPRGAYDVRLERLAVRLENRDKVGARECERLRVVVGKLIACCERIPAEGRAGELLGTWWRCLDELGLLEALRRSEGTASEASSLGRAVLTALARDQAAGDALREFAKALEEALSQAGVAQRTISRALFHRWLNDAARDVNLLPRGKRNGAIRILDARETPGRRFQHVLLGGVVDGRFPGRATPHALFPDEDRAAVNRCLGRPVFELAAGEDEGRLPRRMAEDRLLFYTTLTAAERGVTVTMARRQTGGGEQIPSPFFSELVHLCGQAPEAVPWRAIPGLEEVWTEQELRACVALESFAPKELRTREPELPVELVRGRFSVEPWLGEADLHARIERERLRFFSRPEEKAGPYTGLVARDDTRALLAELLRFDKTRPLSASALGMYGHCAYRGFLAQVLKLNVPREADEEMDGAGEGTFWHAILERLFPLLKERGLLRTPPESLPDDVIDEALQLAAEDAQREVHIGHPALWALGHEKARKMVRRVLAAEGHGLPFDGHEPWLPEVVFGKEDAPEGWRQVRIPGPDGEDIFVEGKIDRLDRAPKGLGVVDYKRRRMETPAVLYQALLTTEYQLPLYLYAARASGHGETVQAAWLSMRTGETRHLNEVLVVGGQSVEDLLASDLETRRNVMERGGKNLVDAVQALVSQLRSGSFPPRADDCGFCTFGSVCRVSTRSLEGASDE